MRVYKQVRPDVRRDGIGEVSLIVAGGSDARDVGRSEGCGVEGARQGTRFPFLSPPPPPNFPGRWIPSESPSRISFFRRFVIYRGERLVYAWACGRSG